MLDSNSQFVLNLVSESSLLSCSVSSSLYEKSVINICGIVHSISKILILFFLVMCKMSLWFLKFLQFNSRFFLLLQFASEPSNEKSDRNCIKEGNEVSIWYRSCKKKIEIILAMLTSGCCRFIHWSIMSQFHLCSS